jgi:hypothetical protein
VIEEWMPAPRLKHAGTSFAGMTQEETDPLPDFYRTLPHFMAIHTRSESGSWLMVANTRGFSFFRCTIKHLLHGNLLRCHDVYLEIPGAQLSCHPAGSKGRRFSLIFHTLFSIKSAMASGSVTFSGSWCFDEVN